MSRDNLDQQFPMASDRLRRTLGAVADATVDRGAAMPPAAVLTARRGPATPPGDVLTARRDRAPRPRGPRRLLAAAAAVAVAVVAIGALVVARDDESTDVVSGPGALATGWYLPPEGWTVTSVDTDYLDVGETGACPCTTWLAVRPGDEGAVVVLDESGAPGDVGLDGAPVDVGGRPGMLSTRSAGLSGVTAEGGGRRVAVVATGLDDDDLVALADAALDRLEAGGSVATADLPLPDGFVGTTPVARVGRFEHRVIVTAVEESSGRELAYQVAPAGDYLRANLLAATSLAVEDGVVTASLPAEGTGEGGEAVMVAGPPEDVVVGGAPFGGPADAFDDEELRRFAQGLREVTTPEWRAALAEATGQVDPAVAEAATIASPPLTG